MTFRAGAAGKSSGGGVLGNIPVKYKDYGRSNLHYYGLAHPDFTRTGSYYLPPVSIPVSSLQSRSGLFMILKSSLQPSRLKCLLQGIDAGRSVRNRPRRAVRASCCANTNVGVANLNHSFSCLTASQGYVNKPMPVMLAFHGAGGQGSDMTSVLKVCNVMIVSVHAAMPQGGCVALLHAPFAMTGSRWPVS